VESGKKGRRSLFALALECLEEVLPPKPLYAGWHELVTKGFIGYVVFALALAATTALVYHAW
jgi:hypothetical protein